MSGDSDVVIGGGDADAMAVNRWGDGNPALVCGGESSGIVISGDSPEAFGETRGDSLSSAPVLTGSSPANGACACGNAAGSEDEDGSEGAPSAPEEGVKSGDLSGRPGARFGDSRVCGAFSAPALSVSEASGGKPAEPSLPGDDG